MELEVLPELSVQSSVVRASGQSGLTALSS